MPALVGQVEKSKHIRNVLLGQTNVLLNPIFSHSPGVDTLSSESMCELPASGGEFLSF